MYPANHSDLPSSPQQLLRACVYIELRERDKEKMRELACRSKTWSGLANQAERHGMAPLLYQHLTDANITIPKETMHALRALTIRHRRSNEIRTNALIEILNHFRNSGNQTIVLKGGALAHVIYPAPGLRSMSDLDVLVPPKQSHHAQQLLRRLGYHAPDRRRGMKYDHNHLAIATRISSGLQVSVEIHRDAIAGDAPGNLTFDSLTEEPLWYRLGEISALRFNHTDMLRHLCRNLAEPAPETKLIFVTDIYAYLTQFAHEIDWDKLHRKYLHVINALRCLHYLSPLTDMLREKLRPSPSLPPSGVGQGIYTLSSVPWSSREPKRIIRALWSIANAPPWWLHVYYGVDPEKSIAVTRYITHPMRIFYWVLRRIRAFVKYSLFSFARKFQLFGEDVVTID
jgi:hypothetical protein